MSTFTIRSRPHDDMQPPKIVEVQLCLASYPTNDGTPALTPMCITEEEVEVQFERLIAEIKKKKSEAKALIRRSDEAHAS